MWWIIIVYILLSTASFFLSASRLNSILVIQNTEFLLNFRFFRVLPKECDLGLLLACPVDIFLLLLVIGKCISFT